MRPTQRGKSLGFLFIMVLPAVASLGRPQVRDEPATAAIPQLEDRFPDRRVSFPEGVTSFADVTYSELGGFRPLTLDLYVPETLESVAPVIVYIHGGGWFGGHSRQGGAFENWPRVLASFAERGYVVASVNYRLSSEAASPAAAHDVGNAVSWLRRNAARYSIDKNRIGLWGVSAGGQLAAIVGTACVELACVQAVVTWYGVFDLAPMVKDANPQSPPARYLGCSAGSCSDAQIRLASAIRHVDESDPPFLLVHGTLDRTVPPSQSRDFHAALRTHGVPSELLLIEGVDHSFIGRTPEETRSASLHALQATREFFDCTLLAKRDGCR